MRRIKALVDCILKTIEECNMDETNDRFTQGELYAYKNVLYEIFSTDRKVFVEFIHEQYGLLVDSSKQVKTELYNSQFDLQGCFYFNAGQHIYSYNVGDDTLQVVQ